MYIASQVLVFTGIAVELIGRLMKSKRLVLVFLFIACLFYVSSYICLKSPLPAIINGINVLRSFTYAYLNEKNKPFKSYVFPIVLTVVLAVPFVVIFWTGPLDLFMLASVIVLSVGLAIKNMLTVRLCLMANNSMWAVYNFTIKG